METDDVVCEISIQSHYEKLDLGGSREVAHVLLDILPGAKAMGMLAKTPIENVDSAAIAAVAVMRSRRITFRQRLYSTSVAHVGSFVSVQTHVPPESVKIVALT